MSSLYIYNGWMDIYEYTLCLVFHNLDTCPIYFEISPKIRGAFPCFEAFYWG